MGGESLILLDTHCLIWMDQADRRMGGAARRLADAALEATELAVSVISFWEVALLERGVVELPLGGGTCTAAAQLRDFHADPADRFIVATTQVLGATLVTADERILGWTGPLERHDALSGRPEVCRAPGTARRDSAKLAERNQAVDR